MLLEQSHFPVRPDDPIPSHGPWPDAPPLHEGPPGPGVWPAPAGTELLARLRETGRVRPDVDTELVAELRRRIESGIADAVAALGPSAPTVRVTKARLTQVLACEGHLRASEDAPTQLTVPLARGALVDALFRQLATTGSFGDPMVDGRDALAEDGRRRDLVAFIDELSPALRAQLTAEVDQQAADLCSRWPALSPRWLPRTQEAILVPVAGGRVLLTTRVDLALGGPAVDRAAVCLVELKSGSRRLEHRSDVHFAALLEMLRSGAPPFAGATYYTRSGELDVEPVTADLLLAACSRTVAGAERLCRLASGMRAEASANPLCRWCQDRSVGQPAQEQAGVSRQRGAGSVGERACSAERGRVR